MKLLNRQQIETIARFKSGKYLTTSFFLNTDKSYMMKKEILVSAKNLLTDGRTRLDGLELDKDKKTSLSRDLDMIHDYFGQNMTENSNGLAVFSCQGEKFWQDVHLPHPPRNRILFDLNPYIRPLSQILGRYHRICVFLIGRREAKWYNITMGEIAPLDSLTSDVPAKIKEGGFEGTEAKRIERHIEAHLHEHFKTASQRTFDLFKKDAFDWLFIGCEDNYFSDLELYLHRYLLDRLKGRIKARPSDTLEKTLKEAVELEETLNTAAEQDWVKRYVAELEKGGLAVSGIKDTIRSLNRLEVQTLLVTHNFSAAGKICPRCRFLYIDESVCPSCQKQTNPVPDVVDEGIEAAFKEHAEVKHVSPPSRLDHYGKIGALLRFKV
jgi:peptide subunit release factor 1 (eRF1)